MLRVENLTARYGAIEALRGVTLEVPRGAFAALIGANGAGKSTLMLTLCGQPNAPEGRVELEGEDITRLPTEAIVRRGVALVPEGRRIFSRLTVEENLHLGAWVAPPAARAQDLEKVYTLFPRLKERRRQRGGTLSGGEQQMLAVGRALMGRPRLLLLDEPSLGLAPLAVRQIFGALKTLNAEADVTVFLVEQNAHLALRLADRAWVMAQGRIVLEGSGAELLRRPEVRDAYLGEEAPAPPPLQKA